VGSCPAGGNLKILALNLGLFKVVQTAGGPDGLASFFAMGIIHRLVAGTVMISNVGGHLSGLLPRGKSHLSSPPAQIAIRRLFGRPAPGH
jgi:hypothetical protein